MRAHLPSFRQDARRTCQLQSHQKQRRQTAQMAPGRQVHRQRQFRNVRSVILATGEPSMLSRTSPVLTLSDASAGPPWVSASTTCYSFVRSVYLGILQAQSRRKDDPRALFGAEKIACIASALPKLTRPSPGIPWKTMPTPANFDRLLAPGVPGLMPFLGAVPCYKTGQQGYYVVRMPPATFDPARAGQCALLGSLKGQGICPCCPCLPVFRRRTQVRGQAHHFRNVRGVLLLAHVAAYEHVHVGGGGPGPREHSSGRTPRTPSGPSVGVSRSFWRG